MTIDLRFQGRNSIALLGEDTEMVEALSECIGTKGVKVLRFSDIDTLIAGMGPVSRTILVLDTRSLPRDREVASLMNQVKQSCGARPVLACIAHSREIDLRLQALRAGAEEFFVSPVAVDELAARLLELGGGSNLETYRVMVVDDDPVAALFAARVLKNAGMQTRIAGDALRVLEVLEELRPDLVLMDLYMPGADGIELTTLIREHDELYDTPVVFLSSELDRDKQMDALRVGGNDFIAKPVRPERLVESVRQSIQSFRSTRGRQRTGHEHDNTIGLMNGSAFLQRLDSSLARGIEQDAGNGVLMIEIDLPDSGSGAGWPAKLDALMERLADQLRGRLETTEYATRFGEKRFAILARRKNEDALLDLAEALRVELAAAVAANSIQVRIGIGRFHPRADDALTMISRAEKACSQAGAGDGSRVGIYRPVVPEGSDSQRDVHLVAMIEEALISEGFHLMHQPIVALRGVTGERYDVSLRLKAPDGEYIPAFDFLPAAHRRGLVPDIDRWVMGHALDRLRQEMDSHQRLRFFVHQTMETLTDDSWLPWFRSQIVAHNLIKQPPILQFGLDDVSANRKLASIRFGELRRLAIKTCINVQDKDEDGGAQVLDLTAELGFALVRLQSSAAVALDTTRLSEFAARVHEIGAETIVAWVDDPQTIAHVFGCGVDFIQGKFLQLPSEELHFDFSESALI